jgi:DNA-binding transcriptional ArsR family regulator
LYRHAVEPSESVAQLRVGGRRRLAGAAAMMAAVTIVFRVPASAAERVGFAYSPSLEAVLSLHVLVEPKHHPVQHGWVRAMRGLSPALKREINAFAFAFRAYFPEFLFPSPAGELLDFGDELRRLRATDPELVRLEFAIPLIGPQAGGGEARDPAMLEEPAVRRRLRERAAAAGDEALAGLLLDDPVALLERFLGLLERYWEDAFAAEWERIEPDLAASVAEAGRQIEEHGLYALLRGLWPEVRSDPQAERFWLERPHDHEVEIGPEDRLVLAPSTYVWPHVRVNCDAPWPLGLVFPASSIVREASPRIPPAALVGVLRALADDTRLRALRLIAERPRSTQELAPLVGITEAALSKHLRVLAEAGLLERRREGYYVLYRLVPEQLAAVSPSLGAFLAREPGARTDSLSAE